MEKYVWLNLNTGEFSKSWNEEQHKSFRMSQLEDATRDNWKLIKYSCINDAEFELYDMMQVTTRKNS